MRPLTDTSTEPDREALARYAERLAAYEPPPRRRPERGARMPARRENERRRVSSAASIDHATRDVEPRDARRPAPSLRAPRLRARRALAVLVAIVAGCMLISYSVAMLQPSNVSLGVRSVEWLRNHGMAWLVNDVENLYYSLNAPKKGGPALKALPKVGVDAVPVQPASYQPPPIHPAVLPGLPDEGRWRATGVTTGGRPSPVLVTTFRPDPSYPQLVAGVAWIDHTRTRLQLYPGRYEPPLAQARGPAEVPPDLRSQLVAAFNSAFKLEDSSAGFVANGHVYAPLRDGLATLVGRPDGSVDLRSWSGGSAPGPAVSFARQNLPLIIDGGHLNPKLTDGREWGATLGNAVRVWRSGVGIDAHGNLLYAAANYQTVSSLAKILRRAGAVRAMELDINYEWVSFNTFAAPGARGALKLLPGMERPPSRYLTPDDRDFFAVFSR